jgi:hypothetical protein
MVLKITAPNNRCVLRKSKKCPAVATYNPLTSRIERILHEHIHAPQLRQEAARREEKRMIAAAAAVGTFSTVTVMARIKTNVERGDCPEAASSIRKSRALSMAILREKKKQLGCVGKEPNTVEEIIEKLPEHYKKTATGGNFLRYCGYIDEEEGNNKKLIMLYLSDHGAWVLSHATDIFADGTFDTRPPNFGQVYFINAQMKDKRPIPVGFALLPNKDTRTYRKLWDIIISHVKFEPGLPERIVTDFELAAANTLKEIFPQAHISGCLFHLKQALRRNIREKGLQQMLDHNVKFQYFVDLLYGLAFVPETEVSEMYETVVQDYLEANANDEGFQAG